MAERPPPRARPLGALGMVLLGIVLAGVAAGLALGLAPGQLVPGESGLRVALEFLGAALRPALDYEAQWVPENAPPFLLTVASALWRTVVFAAAAVSLAVVLGLPLGFLASEAWWRPEAFGGGRLARWARPLRAGVRVAIALLRSVHELLWAVILLAAMGAQTATAVVAIAIPYTGTLAKVFSEMLDEADPAAAQALRASGARPGQVFLFGLLPRALPDMAAYAFYRLECGVRSAAILGFFGYPTLGYHLELSFGELHFREVWTYLWALSGVVLVFEGWSALLRRRIVA